MNDCYSDHKDWRMCKKEVRYWMSLSSLVLCC